MAFAIAVKTSVTLVPSFALVSKNSNPSSSAYDLASAVDIFLASPSASSPSAVSASPSSAKALFELPAPFVQSSLLPTRAITIPGDACF